MFMYNIILFCLILFSRFWLKYTACAHICFWLFKYSVIWLSLIFFSGCCLLLFCAIVNSQALAFDLLLSESARARILHLSCTRSISSHIIYVYRVFHNEGEKVWAAYSGYNTSCELGEVIFSNKIVTFGNIVSKNSNNICKNF